MIHNALSEMGVQVEALHHEVAPGQHEIDIHYDKALKTAPYLAFAVILKAGLDGIKRNLTPPEPAEEDLYHINRYLQLKTLPSSLNEALNALKNDELIASALGPHVYERFMEAKRQEWAEHRLFVTQWELDRYLSMY